MTMFLTAGASIRVLSQNTNWNTADLENYAYYDNGTYGSFPTTMGEPSTTIPGFFPYYSFFKSHNA